MARTAGDERIRRSRAPNRRDAAARAPRAGREAGPLHFISSELFGTFALTFAAVAVFLTCLVQGSQRPDEAEAAQDKEQAKREDDGANWRR